MSSRNSSGTYYVSLQIVSPDKRIDAASGDVQISKVHLQSRIKSSLNTMSLTSVTNVEGRPLGYISLRDYLTDMT